MEEIVLRAAAQSTRSVALQVIMGRTNFVVERTLRRRIERAPIDEAMGSAGGATAVSNAQEARGIVGVHVMARAIADEPTIDIAPADRDVIERAAPWVRDAIDLICAGYSVSWVTGEHRTAYGWTPHVR